MNTQNFPLKAEKPHLTDWIILFSLMLIWGSSFILIKKGLNYFESTQLAALRLSISFLFFIPSGIAALRKVKPSDYHLFVIAGLIGNGIPAFLFARAQMEIDSYMAGILNTLTPLFTLVTGVFVFQSKTRLINVAGVIAGFIGAVGLLSVAGKGSLELNSGPASLIIVATIGYGFQMNFIKNNLSGYDPVVIASISFLFTGWLALIYLIAGTDFISTLIQTPETWNGLAYISFLAIVGTSMAIVANYHLIRRTSALFASSVTYLMPVVAILWGILDGEAFRASYFVWLLIILCGVYLAGRPVEKIKENS